MQIHNILASSLQTRRNKEHILHIEFANSLLTGQGYSKYLVKLGTTPNKTKTKYIYLHPCIEYLVTVDC